MIPAAPSFNTTAHGAETYLITTVRLDDVDGTREALEAGSDPFALNASGESALFVAACKGNVTMLELLEEYGALKTLNDRFTPEKLSPLHGAVSHRRHEAVQWLLQKGALANVLDCQARSPLHTAVDRHDTAMIRLLVTEGKADVNKIENPCKYTALHTAVFRQSGILVQELIRLGADPGQKDDAGRSPLQIAAWKGQLECVKPLFGETTEDKEAQVEALMESLFYRHDDVSLYLLEKDIDLNTPSRTGRPLMNASIQKENEPIIEKMLQRGAKPDVRDKSGMSPLMLAAQRNFVSVARLLLKYRADPDIDSGFGRPLHAAATNGYLAMAETLIAGGANPLLKDEHGHTPRTLAVMHKKTDLIIFFESAEKFYVHKNKPNQKIKPFIIP